IRADDGRVPPRIAESDPSLLEYRHIGDAVRFREVVRGRKPMTTPSDDDHVVGSPGLRVAPRRLPPPVTHQGLSQQAEDRIAHGPQSYRATLVARPGFAPAGEEAPWRSNRPASLFE